MFSQKEERGYQWDENNEQSNKPTHGGAPHQQDPLLTEKKAHFFLYEVFGPAWLVLDEGRSLGFIEA